MIIRSEPDLTYRVLKVAADAHAHDDLFWRCDQNYAPITFWVHCGSVLTETEFAADLQEVTEDNIFVLEDALTRVKLLAPDRPHLWVYAYMLFICRVTSSRPVAAAYPKDLPQLWPWLDICGPERTLPVSAPDRKGQGA